MKISEVIHQFESEEVINPVINSLIKETLYYLSSLCKVDEQWDLTLIDELEEEQIYTPTQVIKLINESTLSFAKNAEVPIVEYDINNENDVVLPAIKTKTRRIDINQMLSFELPLICILQQVCITYEEKEINDQQLVDISRLLQCYLANCANLQFSVLWDEEYDRTTQAAKARDYKKAFSKQHELAREAFNSYIFDEIVIKEKALSLNKVIKDAITFKENIIFEKDVTEEVTQSWQDVNNSILTIWSKHFYHEAMVKLNEEE